MTPKNDPAVAAVRRARESISREFGNDPRRLIAHYVELQKAFEGTLIAGPESPPAGDDAAENAAASGGRAAPAHG